MRLSSAIDAIVADAIERRIFPGAVVLVATGNTLRHYAAYGSTIYTEPAAQPVEQNTIYDVASLTKVFTATTLLRLFEAGLVELDQPVAAYLPAFRAESVMVRHLLTHTSGLDLRLSAHCRSGRDALLAAVYALQPAHTPGTVIAYTNINALLLGEIITQVSHKTLDAAIAELVTGPLDMRDTCFCPAPGLLARIAPTEHDADWRERLVHGSVHDESAHALGGVAGHAGLFSTACDLYTFCLAWLYDQHETPPVNNRLLQPATIAAATSNHTEGMAFACGLGWMLDRPNFMGAAPRGTFGHTGFTGPAMIVVPQQHLIVIVLNNRVYPQRSAPAHHAVIAEILHTAIALQ